MTHRITRATEADLLDIVESGRHWTDPMPADSTWWVVDGDPEHGYAGAEVRVTGDVTFHYALHLTRCYVHADLRGRGLQQRLIRVRLAWGRRQGAAYATTYTHARNVASVRALQRCGFMLASATHTDGETWQTWGRAL